MRPRVGGSGSVAERELREALVLDDLQHDEPRDEHAGQDHHDHCGGDDPREEQPLFLPVVSESREGCHGQNLACASRRPLSKNASNASQTRAPVNGGAQRSVSGTVTPATPSIQNKMNS